MVLGTISNSSFLDFKLNKSIGELINKISVRALSPHLSNVFDVLKSMKMHHSKTSIYGVMFQQVV